MKQLIHYQIKVRLLGTICTTRKSDKDELAKLLHSAYLDGAKDVIELEAKKQEAKALAEKEFVSRSAQAAANLSPLTDEAVRIFSGDDQDMRPEYP